MDLVPRLFSGSSPRDDADAEGLHSTNLRALNNQWPVVDVSPL